MRATQYSEFLLRKAMHDIVRATEEQAAKEAALVGRINETPLLLQGCKGSASTHRVSRGGRRLANGSIGRATETCLLLEDVVR